MCKLQSMLSSSHLRLPLDDDDFGLDDSLGRPSDFRLGAEPSSACLWAMVDDFLEAEYTSAAASCDLPLRSTHAGAKSGEAVLKGAIQEMEALLGESAAQADPVEANIASCVAKALKLSSSMVGGAGAFNEHMLPTVIKHLQREGYNAGLCVTARKPGNAAGVSPTGGYQYIDVILEELVSGTPQLTGKRSAGKLIVDVGFAAHFEIARPLPAYQKLMDLLPSTFIGKPALLQKVVRVMSQAVKASLESQGMSIPPWRSFSYLLAKWLSPSCSRITSVDKAIKHIDLKTSSGNRHLKPRALAELDRNADLANLADLSANDDNFRGSESKPIFLKEEDAANAWCPPPPMNLNPVNYHSDDTSSSYIPKRRQASVVSALALAFAESQVTHNMCAAGA